jgi:hypothetical protein
MVVSTATEDYQTDSRAGSQIEQGSNGAKVKRSTQDDAKGDEYQYGMRHCTIRPEMELGVRI